MRSVSQTRPWGVGILAAVVLVLALVTGIASPSLQAAKSDKVKATKRTGKGKKAKAKTPPATKPAPNRQHSRSIPPRPPAGPSW